jgi:FkbM family methyltransferase
MNKFFCNLFSAFILKKKNRKHFRVKYSNLSFRDIIFGNDKKYKMINELKNNVNEINNLLVDKKKIYELKDNINNIASELKNDINKINNLLAGRKEIFSLRNVDLKDYEQDLINLKANLENKELSKIEHIIKRMEKVAILDSFLNKNLIYTEDELFKFLKMNSMKNSIKNVDGHYELYNYKLPINSFESSIFYDKYKLDELKTIKKIKDTNKAIIDLGAYCGDSLLILKEFFPNNKLYAVEPVKQLYDLIIETIKLNNLKNIFPLQLAFGNENIDKIEMKYAGHKSESKLMTLDKYVDENNLDIGLIKTDVEGAEWDFLHGAINTIKKQKPILVISIYHNYRDFFKIKPFIESLNCGYKFSFCDSCYGIFPIHEITLNCEIY